MRKRKLQIGSLTLYDELDETSYHLPKCPQYRILDSQKRLGFRLNLSLGRMLSAIVGFQVSQTSGSSAGFFMGPFFQPQTMVERSPVFLCIFKMQDRMEYMSSSEFIDLTRKTEEQLLGFYQARLASPCEINRAGETHFEVRRCHEMTD